MLLAKAQAINRVRISIGSQSHAATRVSLQCCTHKEERSPGYVYVLLQSQTSRHPFSLFMIAASTGHAEIYKWVDDNRKDNRLEQEVVSVKPVDSNWSRYEIDIEAVGVELTDQEHRQPGGPDWPVRVFPALETHPP